jgi:hypothetical protein
LRVTGRTFTVVGTGRYAPAAEKSSPQYWSLLYSNRLQLLLSGVLCRVYHSLRRYVIQLDKGGEANREFSEDVANRLLEFFWRSQKHLASG